MCGFCKKSMAKNNRIIMRVLLISNQRPNKQGIGNPIMYRMLKALQNDKRIENVDFMPFYNSFSSFRQIRNAAKNVDLVHIHFGGLYALLIRIVLLNVGCKKFITFHGTDIHAKAIKTTKSILGKIKIKLNQYASFISIILFDKCGFVADEMREYVPRCLNRRLNKVSFLHRLGVDYDVFKLMDKEEAKKKLELKAFKYVLFSDVSNTTIKRRDIAEQIVNELGAEYKLLIMCGVKPDEVPYYINASEFLLLTSDEEGSPNIIRECLALNKSVFSVDVGDAAKQLKGLHNSKIISRNPMEAVKIIKQHFQNPYIDNTRENQKDILDFQEITKEVVNIYQYE